MNPTLRGVAIIATLLSLVAGYVPTGAAAVPDGINYQGYLTNIDGTPVDTNVSITFATYNVDVGGVPLWSQTELVVVDKGLFSVTLGNPANPFPAGMFNSTVYIGLFVAGEEMLPRRQLTSVPYAFKASDSDTVGGIDAAALDQSADVSSLQTDVSALQTTSSSNETRISSLETIGADITSVTAGPGLAGGGPVGDISLGVATGGINATMIAPNSVGSAAIQDGQVSSADIADSSIGAVDIDASQNFTFGGANINGPVVISGNMSRSLTIDSGGDIRIHERDNVNGLRWYQSDGTTQMAYFYISPGTKEFVDTTHQNRRIFRSTANGIGIGTTNPSASYAVTMPSLLVTGNVGVGLTRVQSQYTLSRSGLCPTLNNQACFFNSGRAVCPVGTRVLGGGTNGQSEIHGALSKSYPDTDTSWFCGNAYTASVTRICYAICARLN